MPLTSCGDLLPSSRNSNNDTLPPTLVASFESCSHDTNVSSTVECVVAPTICHFNQFLLNGLILELRRIDKIRSTELFCPLFFIGIHVHYDDLCCFSLN